MSPKSITRTTRSFFQVFTSGANFWALGTGLMVPIFTAGRIAGHIQPYEGVTEHDYPDFRFLGIMKRKKRSPRAASKKIGE